MSIYICTIHMCYIYMYMYMFVCFVHVHHCILVYVHLYIYVCVYILCNIYVRTLYVVLVVSLLCIHMH